MPKRHQKTEEKTSEIRRNMGAQFKSPYAEKLAAISGISQYKWLKRIGNMI